MGYATKLKQNKKQPVLCYTNNSVYIHACRECWNNIWSVYVTLVGIVLNASVKVSILDSKSMCIDPFLQECSHDDIVFTAEG